MRRAAVAFLLSSFASPLFGCRTEPLDGPAATEPHADAAFIPSPVDAALPPSPVDLSFTPPPVDLSFTPPPVDVSFTPPPVDAAGPPPPCVFGGQILLVPGDAALCNVTVDDYLVYSYALPSPQPGQSISVYALRSMAGGPEQELIEVGMWEPRVDVDGHVVFLWPDGPAEFFPDPGLLVWTPATGLHQLNEATIVHSAFARPDGGAIILRRYVQGQNDQLVLADPALSNLASLRLDVGVGPAYDAAFVGSGGDARIVIGRMADPLTGVSVHDGDGRLLLALPDPGYVAGVSERGRRALVVTRSGQGSEIHLLDLDAQTDAVVATYGSYSVGDSGVAALSPDGQTVLALTGSVAQCELVRIDAPRGGPVTRTTLYANSMSPPYEIETIDDSFAHAVVRAANSSTPVLVPLHPDAQHVVNATAAPGTLIPDRYTFTASGSWFVYSSSLGLVGLRSDAPGPPVVLVPGAFAWAQVWPLTGDDVLVFTASMNGGNELLRVHVGANPTTTPLVADVFGNVAVSHDRRSMAFSLYQSRCGQPPGIYRLDLP